MNNGREHLILVLLWKSHWSEGANFRVLNRVDYRMQAQKFPLKYYRSPNVAPSHSTYRYAIPKKDEKLDITRYEA